MSAATVTRPEPEIRWTPSARGRVGMYALVFLSLVTILLGNDGLSYTVGALVGSLYFLYYGGQLALQRTNAPARRLLLASILYLPLVFVLMVLDKTGTSSESVTVQLRGDWSYKALTLWTGVRA